MRFCKILAYYLYSILEMLIHFKNWLFIWPVFLRKNSAGTHEVRLRQPPVRIKVRGRMDVWSVKETFLDEFYTRYGVEIQDGWTIVDIGAGIGDFSIYAAYGKPHAIVYAFEPFVESYQLLIKNLTLNAIDNVIAFQRAVWSHSGTLSLDLSSGEPLQIFSHEIEEVKESGKTAVQALSLKDLFKTQNIERVDLLKMDCEGAEYQILMHTPSQGLKRIDRLILEYHDFSEGRNHKVLIPFLKKEGFRVKRFENVVHEEIGYLFATRL